MRTRITPAIRKGDALVANPLSQFAATTSAQLKGVLSDEMAGLGTLAAFGTSGVEVAYGGTITWAFGAGAAPSGTSSLRQFYTQVGNCVTYQISITYATTGTLVTNVTLTFPTEFPAPATPTGFTGANVRIWIAHLRCLPTPGGSAIGGTNTSFITRNAGDTAFEISGAAFTAASLRTVHISGSYFTS